MLGQGNVLLAMRFKLRNSSPVVHAQCLLALSPLIEFEGLFEVSRPCISQQVFRRRRHAVLFSLPCFMIYSPQREALTGNRKIPRKDCRGGARRVVFFNGKRKKSPRPLLKRQELCAWSQVLGERDTAWARRGWERQGISTWRDLARREPWQLEHPSIFSLVVQLRLPLIILDREGV